MHIYVYIINYIYMYVCMYVYLYICVYINVYFWCVYMYILTYLHTYSHTHMYIYIVYICIYYKEIYPSEWSITILPGAHGCSRWACRHVCAVGRWCAGRQNQQKGRHEESALTVRREREVVSYGTMVYHNWLVVSIPLKNMKVNGKDYPIYDGK